MENFLAETQKKEKQNKKNQNQETFNREIESNKESKESQSLNSDEIEEKLNETCRNNNINIRFTKKSDGKFMFGSKLVQIKSAHRGKIILEIGGGSFTISEFLKLFAFQEEKKMKKYQNE
jgi:uncharacterized FlaG/YvyC family protein